jgi:hypothetical protein
MLQRIALPLSSQSRSKKSNKLAEIDEKLSELKITNYI